VNMPFMVFSLENLAAVIVRATKHSLLWLQTKNAPAQNYNGIAQTSNSLSGG